MPSSCADALSHPLRARGKAERTIDDYLYSLNGFVEFLGERSLTTAKADDFVAYQIEIAARGKSDSSVRVATYPAGLPGARAGTSRREAREAVASA